MIAEVLIEWNGMIWARGRMNVPTESGTYTARMARQQGDYRPTEHLMVVLNVCPDPLTESERTELERLRREAA